MGDYVTAEDVTDALPGNRLVRLTQDNPNLDQPSEAVIVWAIGLAEGDINGGLAARYAVPVQVANGGATLADTLKAKTLPLVLWWLYERRSDLDMPPNVKEGRKSSLEWLKGVAEGKDGYSLDIEDPGPDPGPETPQLPNPRVSGEKTVLSRRDWNDTW